MNAHVHELRQEQPQPRDVDVGVVEAGDQRAPGQVNAFDAGLLQVVEVAHAVDAAVVADQDGFGRGVAVVHRVDGTVEKEAHNNFSQIKRIRIGRWLTKLHD